MNDHHSKQSRDCAHCGAPFAINPRVGRRHRYCARPECVRISQAVSRRKWLTQNGGKTYYLNANAKDRVRTWRQDNPQYWKKKVGGKRAQETEFVVTKKLRAILRDVALQDLIDTNLALKIGIISHLTGTALQDVIAKEIRRLMLRGHAILQGKIPKL